MKLTFATVLLLFLLFIYGMRSYKSERSHTPSVAAPLADGGGYREDAEPEAGRTLRRKQSGLTELRGDLARRREHDLWMITNVSGVMNSELSRESPQGKYLDYCMITIYEAEHSLDSAPEREYALQADGTLLITSGKPPKTPEQLFRDGERNRFELENGGGPLVQDCAGSLYWFGTWHNQPMPTNEQFKEIVAKAQADLDEIDKMLDPRLVESFRKPSLVESPAKPPDQEPYRLFNVEPEYSEEARRAHWQGDIDVSIAIDEKGKVTHVTVLNSPGMGLDEKVIIAVGQWHFKPKIKDGAPVACTVNARVTFRLL